MATALPTEESDLDGITKLIIEAFERILSEVKSRRDELLAQVSRLRGHTDSTDTSTTDTLRELEEMRAHVEKLSVKQNLAVKKQQESIADIDSEIEKLKTGLDNKCNLKFTCSLDQLIKQVSQFGEVTDESSLLTSYQSKVIPVKISLKYLPTFKSNRFHIDYVKERFYVYHNRMYPIVVYDANEFSFIHEFGDKGISVDSMATGKDFIYVASSCRSLILVYRQADYSLAKECELKVAISQIFVNSQEQVIVIYKAKWDSDCCIIKVYDRVLNSYKLKFFDHKFKEFRFDPRRSHLRGGLLYIYSSGMLRVFDREGNYSHSLFDETGKYFTYLADECSF